MPTPAATAPDPFRCGGLGWLEQTHGSLTKMERRSLLGIVAKTQIDNMAGRLALLRGRRPHPGSSVDASALTPPDTRAVASAIEEADQQPTALRGHSYRTWIYGTALALFDRQDLDEELFFVAAVLHDVGLTAPVPGECFTLRSGRAAAACLEGHREQRDIDSVRDAISIHVQPGIRPEVDGDLGCTLQDGALVDLTGYRLWDLPTGLAESATRRYPWADTGANISRHIATEAQAVPLGRFAFLRRCGFGLAIRAAPREVRGGRRDR